MANNKNYVLLIAIILAMVPLFSSAQWLETTIYIPGIREPEVFTHNTTNNTIYVDGRQGRKSVIAIDVATYEPIAFIPTIESITIMCWNSINNKVYCTDQYKGIVTVIDGTTNAVITTVAVGSHPCVLIYNLTNNNNYRSV